MATHFIELAEYGQPRVQKAAFIVAGVEYVVFFSQITEANLSVCSAVLNPRFTKPRYAHHYDVAFDAKGNRVNKTFFKRVTDLPDGAAIVVINRLERIIIEHYARFNVGIYTYVPQDFRLATISCRLITRRKHKGSTIEVGLEPMGRPHVLRTPFYYD